MTAQDHLNVIQSALARISTARTELESVNNLGAKTVAKLDELNASENPDANEVQILESRLRGLNARRASREAAITNAETALYTAVDEAFAALDLLAGSAPGFDEAATAILPWCGGSIEAARKAARALPAFRNVTSQIAFLHARRTKLDPDEVAPALLKFLEELIAAAPATQAAVAA